LRDYRKGEFWNKKGGGRKPGWWEKNSQKEKIQKRTVKRGNKRGEGHASVRRRRVHGRQNQGTTEKSVGRKGTRYTTGIWKDWK